MECASGWGCRGGWWREGKKMGETQNMFLAAQAVYVHYFKDIRQVALQSDCVTLLSISGPSTKVCFYMK